VAPVSGVAGLVGLDGRPYGAADLHDALEILAPLGCDGVDTWAGRVGSMGVALGVRRRRRVPEDDADTQPVVTESGAVTIADVVLDNRPDVCGRLGLADRSGLADSAIVAHAYARWGPDCCEHLSGEFAVAVADPRRGGVFLARDQIGVRPLHLHHGRGWVGFATTALAVTGFAGLPAEVDMERATEFLALMMHSERSWIRDVVPVPPATAVWISPDGPRRRRYWTPIVGERRRGSADEHAEELRATFDEAVRARLRRRGPIGVMLSGGLDSTAVAATVAAQVRPEPVRTYTSVPPVGWVGPVARQDADESPLVRALARHVSNLRPAFVDSIGGPVIDGDHDLFAAGATPVRNTTNMLWIRAIHRLAAADNIALLFVGSGGNLSFSRDGRRWLVDLLVAGRPLEAWREARAWSVARTESVTATFRRCVLLELAPGWLHRQVAAARGRPTPVEAWLAATGLRPELADRTLRRRLAFIHRRGARAAMTGRDGRAAQAEALAAHEALGGWRRADPTHDIRVLTVCARQPGWARRHRGFDRAAARASMAGRVPDEIRLRRVRGAQLPDWFDRLTDAHDEVCHELTAARAHAPTRALVDIPRLERLVRDWPTREASDERDRLMDYQFVLPRALAVSRYLRWLDRWTAIRRSGAGPTRTKGG
jgi:asparagine synthase (glutamine-hydrolysing)